MDCSIRFEHVSFSYPDGTSALADVSFGIKRNDRVALFGKNGSGKSTLFLTLLGFLSPETGTIYVDNRELGKDSLQDVRAKIGLVFQNPDDQLFCPTIYDDVEFGPWNFGLDKHEREHIVESSLREMDLWHKKSRAPHHLSWGEKRRAALATVFAMKPDILLLDEPTAYLDPPSIRDLYRLLNCYEGTIILATHDSEFAGALCDKALVMTDGKIGFHGDIEILLNDSNLMRAFNLHHDLNDAANT